MTFAQFDLRSAMHASADMAAEAIAAVRASLSVHVPDVPVMIRGDANALEQMFANLLFNAAQPIRPGGHVSMRLTGEGGR